MSGSASALVRAARRLRRDVDALRFRPPVAHVYNPLAYAGAAYEAYLRLSGASRKRVIFLGMNPGPFGMAQTGVPFGDAVWVTDWLRIRARVRRPPREHPRRPIRGFDTPRREVSGQRLWGAVAARFGSPDRFFADHTVLNYCPLVFLEEGGRNRTPDKLPAREREPLFTACDRHLARIAEVLEPVWVVGIGVFAEARARSVLGHRAEIGRIPHPSPANPAAQRDWAGSALRALARGGVCGGRERRRRRPTR